MLLDEYFDEQSTEPQSSDIQAEAGDDSDNLSIASTSTLVADHHLIEGFHKYPELPIELQDRILEEVLTVHLSRYQGTRSDGSKPPPPAVAAVDKKTREQVVRMLKRDDHCAGLLERMCVGQSGEGECQ